MLYVSKVDGAWGVAVIILAVAGVLQCGWCGANRAGHQNFR